MIQELRTGGAERILVSAYRGAREAGHEVFVAASPGPMAAELDTDPFPIPVVERRLSRIPSAAAAVRRAVAEIRPDVVHAHNPTMAFTTGLVTRRGRKPPGLVSLHGGPEKDWPSSVRLVRLSGLAAVACGPGVEAALEENGLTPVAMVPNAVSPAPPRPSSLTRRSRRASATLARTSMWPPSGRSAMPWRTAFSTSG